VEERPVERATGTRGIEPAVAPRDEASTPVRVAGASGTEKTVADPALGGSGRQSHPVVERAPLDPEAQFTRLLAQAKRANGAENYRAASHQYRRALTLKPDSTEAKAGLGIALVNSSSSESGYREAVRLLEEAVKGESRDAPAWLALGMAYQFTSQKPKARDAYQRYLSLEPSGASSGEVRALLKELGE
jgi:Flp pilus assembly protein TadD